MRRFAFQLRNNTKSLQKNHPLFPFFLFVFQYNNLLENRGLVAGMAADVELQQCGPQLQFHRQGAHSFII